MNTQEPKVIKYGRDKFPETDEEAKQYIPQDEASQAVYEIIREMGYSIPDAMLYIFNIVLGEDYKNLELIAKYGH